MEVQFFRAVLSMKFENPVILNIHTQLRRLMR